MGSSAVPPHSRGEWDGTLGLCMSGMPFRSRRLCIFVHMFTPPKAHVEPSSRCNVGSVIVAQCCTYKCETPAQKPRVGWGHVTNHSLGVDGSHSKHTH